MGFVTINPRYRHLLQRHGLGSAERLLALPGLIVTGHPDRNVSRVVIGVMTAYLKREHRVRWRDRLRSAASGFGFASLSIREAITLAHLRRAGVPCPEWVAAGEDDHGRAFLLTAELPGTADLRQFLRDRRGASPAERYGFARRLGSIVARVHAARFDHGDLYAKHVCIDPATGQCYFLDWQRSRGPNSINLASRVRDLAALDATLAEGLATERERLACLVGYVRASPSGVARTFLSALTKKCRQEWLPARVTLARRIRRESRRLLRKRHVREERAAPAPVEAQGIRWLDGEALCVTQEFWHDLGGEVPGWLPLPVGGRGTSRNAVALPGGRRGLLVRRWCDRPLAWLWSVVRGRPLLSPELRHAGACFRRQKHGLDAPRVLAFGQRRPRPWRTESFLLTEIEEPAEERTP